MNRNGALQSSSPRSNAQFGSGFGRPLASESGIGLRRLRAWRRQRRRFGARRRCDRRSVGADGGRHSDDRCRCGRQAILIAVLFDP